MNPEESIHTTDAIFMLTSPSDQKIDDDHNSSSNNDEGNNNNNMI